MAFARFSCYVVELADTKIDFLWTDCGHGFPKATDYSNNYNITKVKISYSKLTIRLCAPKPKIVQLTFNKTEKLWIFLFKYLKDIRF